MMLLPSIWYRRRVFLANMHSSSCQTYEGGFSGYPGLEAHGGYAFCGLAALFLLQKTHLCDLKALLVRTYHTRLV